MTIARCTVLLIVASCLLAWTKSSTLEEPDRQSLHGVWMIETFESGATDDFRTWLREQAKGGKVTITLERVTFRGEDSELSLTYNLDSSKEPKYIDLVDSKENLYQGIYTVSDDTLRVCLANYTTKERPRKFETKQGSDDYVLLILKRKKEK